ncbi:MAG: type II secretion system minor pseudopilin GspI [Steroidobacteraceae bacterium]
MSSGERRPAGFTLIEVVVAMAVVALGLLAVFRVVSDTVNNTAHLRDRTFAEWIADNQLTEIRLRGSLPSVGTASGTVEYAGREWAWESTVSETPVPDLVRVDVEVRLSDSNGEGSLSRLSGFLGKVAQTTPRGAPQWLQPGGEQGDSGEDEMEPEAPDAGTPPTESGEMQE